MWRFIFLAVLVVIATTLFIIMRVWHDEDIQAREE